MQKRSTILKSSQREDDLQQESTIGFILAVIICGSMDLEVLTVKGEENIVLLLYFEFKIKR